MIYALLLFIVFSFISYRLIGVKASIPTRLASSVLSLLFTSAVFYTLYLNQEPIENGLTQFDHYTFLYFITLIVVSLGFSLILEMLKGQKSVLETDTTVSAIDKMRYFFSTRIRSLSLLRIILRNKLLRSTFQDKDTRSKQVSIALKNTLEEAGGIFVKFGQFLSTRSDLFPQDFLDELSALQERVYPVPATEIKAVIEEQLGRPVGEIFKHFDDDPLAAGSIAQVHQATLPNGEEVVVKVLRPHLKKQLIIDTKILMIFSEFLNEKASWARKIGIIRMAEGFIQNLYEEVDFSVELDNMQQMKGNRDSIIYIPEAFEDYSTPEVLVMERLDGVSLNEMDRMIENDEQKQAMVNTIFQEMLTDIFDKGLFHGDPHPGNIFVLHSKQPAFIDFGAVGRLSPKQRSGFRWLLIGINRKNADSMVNGVKNLVENSEDIHTKKLEQALAQFLMRHNFEGNIMDEMGKELFDLMSSFGLKFFPDVAGAFRTIITLQGSLHAINPHFDMSEAIDTYLKNLLNVKDMATLSMENIENDVLNLIPSIRELPKKVDNIVGQLENGKLTFRMSLFADEDNRKFANSVLSLFFTGLSGFALGLLALGALFLGQSEDPNGYSFLDVFGYSGLALSVTMLVRVAIQSMKRSQ